MYSSTRSALVAGIPEGMPVATRLEHEFARLREDFGAVLEDSQSALEYEAVLVFPAVPMDRRGQYARRQLVLDQGDQSTRIGTVDQVAVDGLVEGRWPGCRARS